MARTRSSVESVWILQWERVSNDWVDQAVYRSAREAAVALKDEMARWKNVEHRVRRYDRPERKGA